MHRETSGKAAPIERTGLSSSLQYVMCRSRVLGGGKLGWSRSGPKNIQEIHTAALCMPRAGRTHGRPAPWRYQPCHKISPWMDGGALKEQKVTHIPLGKYTAPYALKPPARLLYVDDLGQTPEQGLIKHYLNVSNSHKYQDHWEHDSIFPVLQWPRSGLQ